MNNVYCIIYDEYQSIDGIIRISKMRRNVEIYIPIL